MTPEEFLEHHGIKGMKWGVNRARKAVSDSKTRKEHFREVDQIKKVNSKAFEKASKDPTFDREVKATRKGQGITGTNRRIETSSKGLFTNRITGNFTNSKGEKVSEDFANAVLEKAVEQNDRRQLAKSLGKATVISAGFLVATAIMKNNGRLRVSSLNG